MDIKGDLRIITKNKNKFFIDEKVLLDKLNGFYDNKNTGFNIRTILELDVINLMFPQKPDQLNHKQTVKALQKYIFEHAWDINYGADRVSFLYPNNHIGKTLVPKNVRKMLDIISKANKKKINFENALIKVLSIGSKAANANSFFRSKDTQTFYNTFVEHTLFSAIKSSEEEVTKIRCQGLNSHLTNSTNY